MNILNWFRAKPVTKKKKKIKPRGLFSTDFTPSYSNLERTQRIQKAYAQSFQRTATCYTEAGVAMDSSNTSIGGFNNSGIVSDALIGWYGSQSFIGYQACALIAQHWLITKACMMPAKDAVRNGYEITVNNGVEVEPDVLAAIKKADVKYEINKNLMQFIHLGRVFGIRIAMFVVESDDPEYYKKPFNIDGVNPGSYKGISQIDPYWIVPQLDGFAAGNPGAINFYEPTWWQIEGQLIHRSHLVIFKTEEVPDILKPTYFYGGVSIPQKIYERVYAAERTANEAPMLALTKRTMIIKTDMSQALANGQPFYQRMLQWAENWNNYGIKTVDLEDEVQQNDTSLADLDAVIMTQYQIVAAASNVPAVKLLGTSPKGFNTTGEFEEANYHEELESIQTHDLTPMLERHHLLLIASEIAPEFGIAQFETSIAWNSLDVATAKEQAEINKLKSENGNALINSGAIDGQDERNRIINDPESGYNGLIDDEIQADPTGNE